MTHIICATRAGFMHALWRRGFNLPECRHILTEKDMHGIPQGAEIFWTNPMSFETEHIVNTAKVLGYKVSKLP